MSEPQWVYVTRVKGWVREHDPATQSGLVPKKDAITTELDPEDFS